MSEAGSQFAHVETLPAAYADKILSSRIYDRILTINIWGGLILIVFLALGLFGGGSAQGKH